MTINKFKAMKLHQWHIKTAIGLVLLAGLGYAAYLLVFTDEPPPDTGDLKLTRRVVAGGDNEGLPESLKQLDPKSLAEIPEDPFDHRAIRYSRERKVLYSAGRDLEDGSEDDLVIPIEF